MYANYFNYFTEIEEHFQRRRGSLMLLSTLDWALIESWREAGLPLEAVQRGIDEAFDKYDVRKNHSRVRRINGLAYCAQAVMTAAEAMKEASVGAHSTAAEEDSAAGFEQERVAAHLRQCANALQSSRLEHAQAAEIVQRLEAMAEEVLTARPALEDLDRHLTVLEEKLFALILTVASEEDLATIREQAQRELAPYRSRMQVAQIRLVEQQFLHKKIFERYRIPRLSLFYMSQQ